MSIETQLERTTSRIIFLLTDTDGVTGLANLSTVLTTFKLTLYERYTLTVINSRSGQDVKNTNGFTVYDTPQTDPVTGETYNVLGRLDAEDNALVGTKNLETHIAQFEWTWGTPLRTGRGAVAIPVQNMALVPLA